MHVLQPKHSKLKPGEAEKLLQELNISKVQLPKIMENDLALPPECKIGDIIKIERKTDKGIEVYYRIVV